MEQFNLIYDPLRDSADVDQFGFVDLRQSYLEKTIAPEATEGNDNYNDINEPDAVGAKPSDVFEAYRMRDEVVARDRAKQSKEKNEPSGE